jgi:hypothetical protein
MKKRRVRSNIPAGQTQRVIIDAVTRVDVWVPGFPGVKASMRGAEQRISMSSIVHEVQGLLA